MRVALKSRSLRFHSPRLCRIAVFLIQTIVSLAHYILFQRQQQNSDARTWPSNPIGCTKKEKRQLRNLRITLKMQQKQLASDQEKVTNQQQYVHAGFQEVQRIRSFNAMHRQRLQITNNQVRDMVAELPLSHTPHSFSVDSRNSLELAWVLQTAHVLSTGRDRLAALAHTDKQIHKQHKKQIQIQGTHCGSISSLLPWDSVGIVY